MGIGISTPWRVDYAKICAKRHWVGPGKGLACGQEANATFILAWVLGPFLPRKRDKGMGPRANLKCET